MVSPVARDSFGILNPLFLNQSVGIQFHRDQQYISAQGPGPQVMAVCIEFKSMGFDGQESKVFQCSEEVKELLACALRPSQYTASQCAPLYEALRLCYAKQVGTRNDVVALPMFCWC